MKRIITVVGARPQFIKVAPVSKAIRAAGGLSEVLIHTGQHFDTNMSDIFFAELGIAPPDHHLQVHGGGHGAMTGAMMGALEPLLEKLQPDVVLVYGDTNSTLAGGLTAAKLNIPIAHVEAGLRSFNRRMPEEVNRVVVDHLSDILLTGTDSATANLRTEGRPAGSIHQVGDVMYDAALMFAEKAASRDLLRQFGLSKGRYVLATLHRAENTVASRLPRIIEALDRVAAKVPTIIPLHPRTRAAIAAQQLELKNAIVVEPLGYLDMVALEASAGVIATDSGGVQKEAFFYQVPCVTLRDETEWVELVESKWNRLAPPETTDLVSAILDAFGSKGEAVTPYGNGDAATRIAAILAAR